MGSHLHNRFNKFSLNPTRININLSSVMHRDFQTILLILALSAVPLKAQAQSLYILHTNNTNGALENCYCPDHPYGSVEKRDVFADAFIQDYPNTLMFDAGDFFPVSPRPHLDSLICVAYGELPYNAVLLGDQELAREPDDLNALLPIIGAPFIGTNVNAPSIGGMVDHVRLKKGEFSVLVFGIIDPDVFKYYPEEVRNRMDLSNPVSSLKSAIAEYRQDGDIVVVLSHQGDAKDRELVNEVKGIDVVIGSHSQSIIANSWASDGPIVAQAGKEGYYVGVIVLERDADGSLSHSGYSRTMSQQMQDSERIMELIHEYEEKTGHINRNKLKHMKKQ